MRISDWSSDVCSSDLVAGPLDQAEIGHGISEGPSYEIQPPVKFLLAQVRSMRTDRLGELAQHMAVVVGEKLAQALVLFGIGAGEHTDKGRAAAVEIRRASCRERVCQYV